jgi:hypothetical protein
VKALKAIGAPEDYSTGLSQNAHIYEWVESSGKPVWLPFPGFPRSGVVELDAALALAESLVNEMMAEILKLGQTYKEFGERLFSLPAEEADETIGAEFSAMPGEHPRRSFVRVAHDFWPNTFVLRVALGLESVATSAAHEKTERAALLATAIRTGFSRPPTSSRTVTSLEQDFHELINLPIWRKRHELYSVWVASRIADALKSLSWEWHPDGNALVFSFSGVELATLRSGNGGAHAFWTEKRTPLQGSGLFGRRHIQPDYRIVSAPTHRDDSTSLVVECKQYRSWNKKNFGSALDDYAKGCPNAPVILVNYGPTDSRILELVDARRRDRTFLVGDFKPNATASLDRFRDIVRDTFLTKVTPRIAATIELHWGPKFQDLDLHMFIQPQNGALGSQAVHVGFRSIHGSLVEAPWAEWAEDIRTSPPGTERIEISHLLEAYYDVLVHDYSGSPTFPAGDIGLKVSFATSGHKRTLVHRGGKVGVWWHVCRIRGSDCRIEEVDRVYPECPIDLSLAAPTEQRG